MGDMRRCLCVPGFAAAIACFFSTIFQPKRAQARINHAPCFVPYTTYRMIFMEAERINTIGNTLEDLRTRTEDLRRYL